MSPPGFFLVHQEVSRQIGETEALVEDEVWIGETEALVEDEVLLDTVPYGRLLFKTETLGSVLVFSGLQLTDSRVLLSGRLCWHWSEGLHEQGPSLHL